MRKSLIQFFSAYFVIVNQTTGASTALPQKRTRPVRGRTILYCSALRAIAFWVSTLWALSSRAWASGK
jgi:hypothetical protein